jgi:TolB-like protein
MSERRSWLGRFFAELRRRRVFRVATAYGVVGFVLAQAADLLFKALNLPPAAYSFFVALILLGFPLAVALAWAFDITPEGVRRTGPMGREPDAEPEGATAFGAVLGEAEDAGAGRKSSAGLRFRRSLWFGAGILVALTGGWLLVSRSGDGPDSPALDEGLIAVFPFRVSGADPELERLGDGMVELLSMVFTGTAGPRAVDPPTAIRAAQRIGEGEGPTREVAIELARSLGARYTLTGAVIGTPARATLNATVLDAASGREVGDASFTDAPEALRELVDRLAGALLSLATGEAEDRLPSLTDTPLPALLAYLEGQATARSGRFAEAGRHFDRALEHDSTFALAALRKGITIQWLNDPGFWGAWELAWRHRDRLSARDRMLLESYGGPRFPDWSPMAEWLPQIERVTRAMPDRAESWYWFGDRLFHQGGMVGWPGALDEALEHFRTTLALDSTHLEPMIHLVEAGVVRGDTAEVRRYTAMLLQADPATDVAVRIRWLAATALGDSVELAGLRAGIGDLPVRALMQILQSAHWPGGPLEDESAIMAELRRRPGPRAGRASALATIAWHELYRGWPGRAAATLGAWSGLTGASTSSMEVELALYWDGDDQAGRRGAEALARWLEDETSGAGGASLERGDVLCTLGQWQAWREGPEAAAQSLEELQRLLPRIEETGVSGDFVFPKARLEVCARVVETVVAVRRGDPRARSWLESLDGFFRTGRVEVGFREEHPLILSRLWEALGDPDRALTAIRNRAQGLSVFRPPVILREARLAAALGDRETAIRWYEHYLRLRSDPEPVLMPEVEEARRALAALTGS